MPVDTNIVIFEVAAPQTPEKILAKLNENNIKALAFSATEIRLVTHLDFTEDMLNKCLDTFSKIKF